MKPALVIHLSLLILSTTACGGDDTPPGDGGADSAMMSDTATGGDSTTSDSSTPGMCGNGICDPDESCSLCPGDCGVCMEGCDDGVCSASEDCNTCSEDCGSCPPPGTCGNGTCEASELCSTCAGDCGMCSMGPPTVIRGPYLQRVSDDEITIKWRTEEDTDSVVAFGGAPDDLTNAVIVSGSTTRHEVRITGLSADTKYFYGFGASDRDLLGMDSDHFFNTAPTPGDAAPTRVWVIGDSGDSGSDQMDVYMQYLMHTGTRGTDLWLMLGDNAYSDGTDSEYQDAVFDAYPELLRNTPLFATLGNHDDCLDRTSESSCTDLPESLDSVTPYYEIFTLPEGGESGGMASGTEEYYSFDYGNIHFVCLNSQTHEDSMAAMTWLEADLAATTAEWIIAFWHHPPYTNGSHNSDREGSLGDMRENFVPILESHGVDLVFTGHSHSYERSALLNGYYGESTTFDPDTHVIARNGDGSLSDGDPSGDGEYAKSGAEGAVYSVVGSSSKTSGSDYPTDYWTCPDGFMMSCDGGPILPGMMVYVEELGSVVVDINESTGVADIVFLNATTGAITDRYRITH